MDRQDSIPPRKREGSWQRRLAVGLAIFAVLALPVVIATARRGQRSQTFLEQSGPQVRRIGLQRVASGLTAPVCLAWPDDGSERLFVVDQIGRIVILDAAGQPLPEPFLEISERLAPLRGMYDERGLLGLAFHPRYADNGRFFVHYVGPRDGDDPAGYNSEVRISEFRVSRDDPNRADPTSERVLLDVNQPQPNHNGGPILFGPDGMLYIGLGDGGARDDHGLGHKRDGNGQDRSTLLGKILRLDVDRGTPYAIPPDNPFVGQAGMRPEIWAYGIRNPWGMSFDTAGDGALYAGDVGQELFEEINIIVRGGNYGWRIREGRHCFDRRQPTRPPAECPDRGADGQPLVEPILEYPHYDDEGRAVGRSIAGGHVYRGSAVPHLNGEYIFGDWSSGLFGDGTLFAARRGPEGAWSMRELQVGGRASGVGVYLLALGQDAHGELYLLISENLGPVGNTGSVYRIVEE